MYSWIKKKILKKDFKVFQLVYVFAYLGLVIAMIVMYL